MSKADPIRLLRRVPYSSLLQRISKARTIDLSQATDDQIRRSVGQIMHGFTTIVLDLALTGAYRAQVNPDSRPFSNVSELWYPPPRFITRRGRFNEPGEAIFYVSGTANGAVFEVRPAPGSTVTLLVVRAKKMPTTLKCAHIGLERGLAPELANLRNGGHPRSHKGFAEMLKKHGVTSRWLKMDNFLSELATSVYSPHIEGRAYLRTNAISAILFTAPDVQALNYPSVATNLRSLNLCMKPAVADELFYGSEAWMLEVEDELQDVSGIEGRLLKIKFTRRSEEIAADGTITWSAPLSNVTFGDIAHLLPRSWPSI